MSKFKEVINLIKRKLLPVKSYIAFIGFVLALIIIFALIVNINIVANTNDNIYSIYETIKLPSDFDCILILGAGVRKDGSPTPMLNDRLITGYQAFTDGKSSVIFISGDSENPS